MEFEGYAILYYMQETTPSSLLVRLTVKIHNRKNRSKYYYFVRNKSF